jgi:hypothetical protein
MLNDIMCAVYKSDIPRMSLHSFILIIDFLLIARVINNLVALRK